MPDQMVLETTSVISQKQFDELQAWWSKNHSLMLGAGPKNLTLPLDNRYIDFELKRI